VIFGGETDRPGIEEEVDSICLVAGLVLFALLTWILFTIIGAPHYRFWSAIKFFVDVPF